VLFVCIAVDLHDASASFPRGGGAAAARWEGWHVAPHREAGCEFVVLRRGVGAESGAFGVGLLIISNEKKMSKIKEKREIEAKKKMKRKKEEKKKKTRNKTYRMRTLVTPSIGRTHIPITIDSLGTTPPERLVTRIRTPSEPYTLNNRTVVVVRDPTRGISILQLKVPAMAADAMELRRWR
jgi:hypothetical protein